MVRRALSVTVTAFTTTAALLLTACGGDGDDSPPDDIKGVDAGASSPSASASASAAGDAGAPDVNVPKDLKLVFEFDAPSDAKHAAALTDAENYIRALKHGLVAQDPNDPAYQYYSGGQAAQYAKSQIQTWAKGGWTPTGTDRYYDANVTTLNDGKRVLVAWCRDQAKAYGKEIKTGKVLYTEASLSSFQKFSLLMFPPSGDSKVWKTQVIEVVGEAKECQA